MPVDLESRFKRLLKEIVTISHGIRNSALDYANSQNFDVSEKLRRQLETIRTSADTILETFAKASLTSHTLDDRLTDWVASMEPHVCLDKLKEMSDMLRPVDEPPQPGECKLTAALAFFENYSGSVFHFLLTPDDCDQQQQPSEASQTDQGNRSSVIPAGREHGVDGPPSNTGQATTTGNKTESIHQKLDEVSRWLTPLECTRKHNLTLKLRQDGTCKWFPSTGAYKKWREPGNRFLWLHGKAGCGKSVFVASTIEHLKTTLEHDEVVVFFYCDFQNGRSTSSTELMRSLLSQLLCHVRDHGVNSGDFADKILRMKSEGTLSLDNLDKLGDLVSRAASFFRYEPLVVIDALDECADIEALLPALVSLSQSDVRLLVTSRPHRTIVDRFSGLPSLSFDSVTEGIATDIGLHVKREVESRNRLRSADAKMKNEIYVKLTEGAEGRFRWARCQLDALERCATEEELKELLNSLPSEIEATYERILGAIDERKSEGELARRVLGLLVVAIEPLRLAQIIDGLVVDFQLQKSAHGTQWGLGLICALSSLVSYDEDTDDLALSHFSVKEYLTSRSALPMYSVVSHEAHAEAARMCMRYISFFLKHEPSRGNVTPEPFPMLSYVFSSGLNHLAYVDPKSAVAIEALQSLGLDARHHPSHWDRLCGFREEILEWPYALWPSSKHDFILYVLIAYSPAQLLRTFLSRNHSLKPRYGTNPLIYAADLRKTEHAMLLLAHGFDVNMRGLVIDDSRYTSPIEVAIDLGDDVLVSELLQRGCLVTSVLLSTAVCMPWCSSRVLVKLVQTNEFAEWVREIGDEKLLRGIFNSARPNSGDSRRADEDHVTLARRLRELGQDISAESHLGQGLVERALYAAHTSMLEFLLPPIPPPAKFLLAAATGDTSETLSVVRFLLQKGVDIHAVSDQRRDSALHLAAMCPWEPRSLELMRLLINAGCDPQSFNVEGETPLVTAVRCGHCSVVDFLLSCGVPLQPAGILHVLLGGSRRNARMIQLLILRGADVHAVAPSTGNTLLHAAMECRVNDDGEHTGDEHKESRCFGLVKCLVEAGCDPTVLNSNGKTVLGLAIDYEFTSVIELLLSHNVTMPPDTLSVALRQYLNPEMAEFLIRKGADVHCTTSDGNSVIHLALTSYSEVPCYKLTKCFIDAGCNPTTRNSFSETTIELAIKRGFISVVELLLSHHVPIPPDVLLNLVQRHSAPRMVELLTSRGADVHCITSDENSVLHLALANDQLSATQRYELTKLLVDAGCDPTTCNIYGETVLGLAIQDGFTLVVKFLLSHNVPIPPDVLLNVRWPLTSEMVELLVDNGADVHCTTSDGNSVIHLVLTSYSEGPCYELTKYFIDAGCDPTTRNSYGQTTMEFAIRRGFISVVEILLSHNVPIPPDVLLDVLRKDLAPKMAELLVSGGANVHCITSDGDSVLHLALTDLYNFEGQCRRLIKCFIDAGCDPTLPNSYGETAVGLAIRRGFTSVVKLLLSHNVPITPDVLLNVLQRRSTLDPIVQLLIRNRGANVHSTTSQNGDTALHLAINEYYPESRCRDLVKSLIDAGCDPAAQNLEGETALEAAVGHGYTAVVELLLSRDVTLPHDILLTALRRRSHPEMIDSLISRGADVHFVTPKGDTALHLAISEYAVEEACYRLVNTFIQAGCNPTACRSDGRSALEVAIEHRYASVVELLLQSGVPFSPDILPTALSCCCPPEMIQLLVDNGAIDHLNVSGTDRDALLPLIRASYAGEYYRQIIDILGTSRNVDRTHPSSTDETCEHVAKRRRLG